jgi:hypothetical protein
LGFISTLNLKPQLCGLGVSDLPNVGFSVFKFFFLGAKFGKSHNGNPKIFDLGFRLSRRRDLGMFDENPNSADLGFLDLEFRHDTC